MIDQAALLDQALEAIVVRDLQARIHYWSRGVERLYGWTAEEVIGHTAAEIHYGHIKSQLAEAINTTFEKKKWDGELRQFTKDVRDVIVAGHWTLLRNAERLLNVAATLFNKSEYSVT